MMRVVLPGLLMWCVGVVALMAEPGKKDERYAFRTDFANEELRWYQTKPLEFPPHHSDHRVSGELVSVDFVHRSGVFRATASGELMDFSLPPYGAVSYLHAESDLRDVPLGTHFLFFLHQDADGRFTRLATAQDQFTMDAGHGFTYRLDALDASKGVLLTTKHSLTKKLENLGKKEWAIRPATRFWKNGKAVKLGDLNPGDELLVNLSSKPSWCSDVWVGTDTHQQAMLEQRARFKVFTEARGWPGWIEKTEGKVMTVTLFSGDAHVFKANWEKDLVVGKSVKVCVSNDELRTWNPPVDGDGASITAVERVPMNGYGCSGYRLVVQVGNMLEGFRKGRVVRLFGPGWKVQDQFYGESLMGYGYGRLQTKSLMENPAKEYPEQFPFRTDYGNRHLPWYQLKAGVKPPPFAEHSVMGVLVKADAAGGVFRAEGKEHPFVLSDTGVVRYKNADASLASVPAGTRCLFHLYQDADGAFTKAGFVTDDFSRLAADAVSWRVDAVLPERGMLQVAWQMPEVKNYNGDMEQPKDIGKSQITVAKDAKVWKDGQQVPAAQLAVGDVIRANLSDDLVATEVWMGKDAQLNQAITKK